MATASDDVATRLVEVTARVLSREGMAAVSARRVTREVGVSTMAVYTHFGGMPELFAAVWREGYRRFGLELDAATLTDDPMADWAVQGWAYRHFALREPHLYQVMFGPGLVAVHTGAPEDSEAALAPFESLLHRLERCKAAGRLAFDDTHTAGELVWATVHGQMMIELSGYHVALARDPLRGYEECLRSLACGFGADPAAGAASLAAARRRARRAGHARVDG